MGFFNSLSLNIDHKHPVISGCDLFCIEAVNVSQSSCVESPQKKMQALIGS